MSTQWIAAAALVLAVGVVLAPLAGARRRLRNVTGAPRRLWPDLWRVPTLGRPAIVVVAVIGAVAGGLAGGLVAAFAASAWCGVGARAVARRARARAVATANRAGLDAVAGLADDLRAGRTAQHALAAATAAIEPAVDEPTRQTLRAVAAAASSGDELPSALSAVRHPGLAPIFTRLAAVWRLSDAGVPLAELLDSLEAELRAYRRASEQAAAQLAAARTTATLLAGLPVVGFALGGVLGVDPLAIVLHSAPGGACAVLAIVLQLAGLAWTERLGRSAVTS